MMNFGVVDDAAVDHRRGDGTITKDVAPAGAWPHGVVTWSGSWPPGLTCGFRCRTRPSDRNQSCGQPPGQMPTACSRHLEEETARTMKSPGCTPPRRSLSLRKTIHDRGKTPLCAHDFSQSHEDLHALVRSIRSLIRKKCEFQWKQPLHSPNSSEAPGRRTSDQKTS